MDLIRLEAARARRIVAFRSSPQVQTLRAFRRASAQVFARLHETTEAKRFTWFVCDVRPLASFVAGVMLGLLHASRAWLRLGELVGCLVWESQDLSPQCIFAANACVADGKRF